MKQDWSFVSWLLAFFYSSDIIHLSLLKILLYQNQQLCNLQLYRTSFYLERIENQQLCYQPNCMCTIMLQCWEREKMIFVFVKNPSLHNWSFSTEFTKIPYFYYANKTEMIVCGGTNLSCKAKQSTRLLDVLYKVCSSKSSKIYEDLTLSSEPAHLMWNVKHNCIIMYKTFFFFG